MIAKKCFARVFCGLGNGLSFQPFSSLSLSEKSERVGFGAGEVTFPSAFWLSRPEREEEYFFEIEVEERQHGRVLCHSYI